MACLQEDKIYGIMYGLRGFYSRNIKPIHLDREAVEDIHLKGGTILVRSFLLHVGHPPELSLAL